MIPPYPGAYAPPGRERTEQMASREKPTLVSPTPWGSLMKSLASILAGANPAACPVNFPVTMAPSVGVAY
jgi:hypothetical protein